MNILVMSNVIEINDHRIVTESSNEENEIIEIAPKSYNEFFENFLLPNKPCVFDAQITTNWPSRNDWKNNDEPNFDYLKLQFGDCLVPIADCNKRVYNAQCKNNMSIKEYINYWIDYQKCNYSNQMPLLYLKDWHCVNSNTNIYFYEVPQYFASDWLNEYFIAHPDLNDDYMFVYMGPKGSWTPLHVDVFTSYSWSANIVGKKRWLFFPPDQGTFLKNKNGDLIYDFSAVQLNDNSNNNNNDFNNCTNEKNIMKTPRSIEIIQESGQIIFVPSGWYHQVWNLEDTISINHNWINGCNIRKIWAALRSELLAVMKEIEDCKDMDNWNNHCQIMLKASFGINYIQFYEFLLFIAEQRIQSVINNVPLVSFKKWSLGRNHCLFDLRQIRNVLQSFIEDVKEKNISSLVFKNYNVEDLILRIDESLSI
ncbi:hypothetical protein TKK_0012099 [Trichogramma kaykai]|uniref:Jumonji domain-containing protein 4 n=1 Tax=Trichogramma kaykai TaxID=54128 RepID=A0ABD2WM08_9HYME